LINLEVFSRFVSDGGNKKAGNATLKNNMKKLVFTLALLCSMSHFSIIAQITNHASQYNASVFMEHVDRIGNNNLDYIEGEYTGTPYSNPIFLLGTIYENNKAIASNYALRYNAMADEIEVKETLYVEDADMKVLSKSPDLYVKIMNDMFIYAAANETNEEAGYFQVLHVGSNFHLYKKIAKKYYPAKKANNSFEKDVLANFADRSSYFLVSKDNKFEEFGKSNSKKLKVFGEKQSEMKKYVSKGKLDLSDENDLIKAVRYYDSISESM
jgi:hypothetical protein